LVRFIQSVSVVSFALLAAACASSAPAVSSDAPTAQAAPPRDLEVSVKMSEELEEDGVASRGGLDEDKQSKRAETHAAPAPRTEDSRPADGPAPPPPPPRNTKRPEPEATGSSSKPTLQAATADSVGGKVDSATIQQAIAKNVGSFKPCLRSDMALRLDATISPSGDVLEANSPKSFPDDAKARDCVVMAVKRLRFERFDGAAPARVSFELTLKRAVDY
jgi:hypothetical protein